MEPPPSPDATHPHKRKRPTTPPRGAISAPTTPLNQQKSTVPPSPYPGLSGPQLKKWQKALERTESKIDFQSRLLLKAGLPLEKDEVVQLIAGTIDDEPDLRTFSKLTNDDFTAMCKYGSVNPIVFNEFLLEQAIPSNLVPSCFLEMLNITRAVSARGLEAGCRKPANLFLDTAVHIARQIFDEKRLIITQEHPTGPVEVPEIGHVQGPLDYVTGRAAGGKDMDLLMFEEDGNNVQIIQPYMVVVEAKRNTTLDHTDSKAQLLAQVRALQILSGAEEGRSGALTDGLKWCFWHRYKKHWYDTEIITRDEKSCVKVLRINPHFEPADIAGILVFLAAGRFPTTDASQPMWITEFLP